VRQLLTREDVAKRLQLSTRTIDRLVAAGQLKVVRLGTNVRVRAEDLEAFIAVRAGETVASSSSPMDT